MNIGFPKLNLPFTQVKVKEVDNTLKIFDPIRKKYIALTPEEFVRRQFTGWLTDHLGYPVSLMANEIGIELNGTKKRCDTVVFGPDGQRFMIVEYKAPDVNITQEVFDQIVRYNLVLRAGCLTVSNGLSHYCCTVDYDSGRVRFLPNVPDFKTLKMLNGFR